MSARILAGDVSAREVWAWAMFDFANSGYTTVVVTALFNAHFVAVVAGGAPWATLAWTAALSASYLLIVLTAPFVGAWADAHAARKRLLGAATIGCVLFTAGLALAGPGAVAWAAVAVAASNFFFGTGENLIAAFLPELARRQSLGRVSGWGWGLGYLGGLAALGLCLAWIAHVEAGGGRAADAVPGAMLVTAAFFAAASLPTFLFLRERAAIVTARAAGSAWERLAGTLRHARTFRDLWRFLLCTLFYQAGIQAVIALAAIYAQQAMGFSVRDTLVLILAVNVTAAASAFAFGHFQDRVGHLAAIAMILAGWLAVVALLWLARERPLFWLAANLAGVCLGASQSAARALVGLLSPPARLAEFFGLWGLAVKSAAIFGPLTYGAVSWASGGDHRIAMAVTGLYFAAGLWLLRGIDLRRGRRAALRSARR